MSSTLPVTPSIIDLSLLLGLSFFLGLAFEDVFAHADIPRPGGIRTFPLLALLGGVLYLFDPAHLVSFTAGLLVLGAWLLVYYREHFNEKDEEGRPNVGLMVLLLNFYAYVLGPIALALPHWVAIGATVVTVLLFAARAGLHELARRVEMREIITAAEFLILTGLVLPLLPDTPVTALTKITPHQVWLALLVVSSVSYASYLSQRYLPVAARGLWMAALGGLYSSTATTVVLAREARAQPERSHQAQAGITLATAIMYIRVLVIVSIFNLDLARRLALPLCGLAILALLICVGQYYVRKPVSKPEGPAAASRNPLELGAAAVFAILFVLTSFLSTWVVAKFGVSGIYWLAAVIGIADIDPFVLNLAQGGATGVAETALAASILIAASSNNLLKAAYAAVFAGGKATAGSAAALVVLAGAGVAIALLMVSS
jgi:uncharacterized membrane protein (DUF4010 family)